MPLSKIVSIVAPAYHPDGSNTYAIIGEEAPPNAYRVRLWGLDEAGNVVGFVKYPHKVGDLRIAEKLEDFKGYR